MNNQQDWREKKAAAIADAINQKQAEVMQAAAASDSDALVANLQADVNAIVKQQEEDWEKEIAWQHRFYTVDINRRGNAQIQFNIVRIIEILMELGFYRYDNEDGSTLYVHISEGKIRQIQDSKVVRDAFVKYVDNLTDYDYIVDNDEQTVVQVTPFKIKSKLFQSIGYYLGEDKMERLIPDEPITIIHDTASYKYFFYRNYVVQVSADGIKHFPYTKLTEYIEQAEKATGEKNGRYIWESSIMDRDYNPDVIGGDFEMFCSYICGYRSSGLTNEAAKTFAARYKSLRSIFGYLMHGNFECNPKAVLFMDVNKDGDNKNNGGTGKGIIGKALAAMLNRKPTDCKYISEGGKNFHADDERRYSNGDLSTQLIHIEDIVDKFNFTGFYNDITEYIPIRKMNVDRVMIRSKIMLSSNTPIDILTTGDSTSRRLVVFELDNYFNRHLTPVDVFGKRFFESKWTVKDWQAFDNFMIDCSYFYMSTKDKKGEDGRVIGIIEPPLVNYRQQLLESRLSQDFIIWFEDKIKQTVISMKYKEYTKLDLYNEFKDKYPEYANAEKYKRAFTTWCKFYLQVMEIPSGEKRSTQDLLILYPTKTDSKIQLIYG